MLALAASLLSLTMTPVRAQSAPEAGPSDAEKPKAPHPVASLDELFERLRKSQSEEEAKGIAGLIQRRWLRSGSDTADLLMSRALEATTAGDQELAIELMDRVIVLQPQWAEAWNKRATLFYMMGDQARAMADIEQVLLLEPRHFGALSGMGVIFQAQGDKKRAYGAYKQALAINPWLDQVKSAVEDLEPEVVGRDI
jgi:tetratricopeptide (TPR) repeat protein